MLAMVFEGPRGPLTAIERPRPKLAAEQVLLRVLACGVCRTDLHIVDGELADPRLPLIPGHEIVGEVIEVGADVRGLAPGDRVGVPWLGWTCGKCEECLQGRENLCATARFTGYHIDGGYADFTVADARYCLPLPTGLDPVTAAPLLCAGLIGYRTLRMAGDARRIGIYGFGAAAHLVAQVAQYEGRRVYAFTRPGDVESQRFASELGAVWAGDSDQFPPDRLDAALIFAPTGSLIPQALQLIRPAGVIVCGGIHMSDIPSFRYRRLLGERVIRSVANLTRRDGVEFWQLADRAQLRGTTVPFALSDTNAALAQLRREKRNRAAVLVPAQIGIRESCVMS
ncbi:MAG: zinc-dependent alcohol dehydrogenase family protein [Planctomycetaceae bacterium]|nr:zinc-dependent alcohol dehydrogenase family protein [Planctomycetaceae bacterium]